MLDRQDSSASSPTPTGRREFISIEQFRAELRVTNDHHKSNQMKGGSMRKLVGLAGLAVLIAMAAPATAEPNDDTRGTDGLFLASVQQDGLSFKDGPAAITAGKQSCAYIDQGHPKSEVITGLSASNPGFSAEDAAKFVTTAAKAYCPQHVADSNSAASPTPRQ
jgi:hypothetical protein